METGTVQEAPIAETVIVSKVVEAGIKGGKAKAPPKKAAKAKP